MILLLNIHYSRSSDVIIPDYLTTEPAVPVSGYRDGFGNWCMPTEAPAGNFRIKTDALVRESGLRDKVVAGALQHAIEDLPEETLVFLLESRYCETELLSQAAWDLFERGAEKPKKGCGQ